MQTETKKLSNTNAVIEIQRKALVRWKEDYQKLETEREELQRRVNALETENRQLKGIISAISFAEKPETTIWYPLPRGYCLHEFRGMELPFRLTDAQGQYIGAFVDASMARGYAWQHRMNGDAK